MFFTKNVSYLKKTKKLTQNDIAVAVGLSNQMISNYEKGVTSPQLDLVQKMADFFGVDAHDLVFTNLETGEKADGRVVDRVTRLLEKELDRLEQLEQKIKANKRIMAEIRKIDPDLANDIDSN